MNFFKKAQKVVEIIDNSFPKHSATPTERLAQQNIIIQEIHDSFYSEVDKLLEKAKIAKPLDTEMQDLIDKSKKLEALGFTKTAEVVEAEIEIWRLQEIHFQNERNSVLVEAINYFSFKYPQYKFITEESVKIICQKYNLVYAEVNRYIGNVPDKNVQNMIDFKINNEDECHCKLYSRFLFSGESMRLDGYLSTKEIETIREEISKYDSIRINTYESPYTYQKCPLEIAAPVSDFNLEGKEIKDFKLTDIHIPDPVVLCPVIFKGTKHYLIVTAWGLEGADELVVNQRNN